MSTSITNEKGKWFCRSLRKTRKLNSKLISETFKELSPSNFDKHPRLEDTVKLAEFVKLHFGRVHRSNATLPYSCPSPIYKPRGNQTFLTVTVLNPTLTLDQLLVQASLFLEALFYQKQIILPGLDHHRNARSKSDPIAGILQAISLALSPYQTNVSWDRSLALTAIASMSNSSFTQGLVGFYRYREE